MKNTALTEKHIALGAKMVPFAGYAMPVQYEGVTIELVFSMFPTWASLF